MDTQVRTPQSVFMQPQQLIVPLFQRPYVWNLENQWEPLWKDVVRLADRLLANPAGQHQPHFLGAVVFQQLLTPIGLLQARTVIDGQQRLTTLQLLIDALHGELVAIGATQPAMRLEALVKNPSAFCVAPEDQFKVWPTNRDRPAFNAVMSAEPPVNHNGLSQRGERLVEAHRYFAERAREWLSLNGPEDLAERAERIEHVARELIQLVVIDLTAEENAQEIFETLNARGAHLTAADLIKNFVFQRLMEEGVDVEASYESNWKDFETGFWEAEMSFGRLKYSRSSIFLNHWLIERTGDEVVAREVFSRFKSYSDFDADVAMAELIQQIHRASKVYRSFVDGASALNPIDRIQLFAYRTSVLESEVFKPVVLWLQDPEQEPIPEGQIHQALDVIESWLVRRMLVRAQTSSYTQIASELITQLRKAGRAKAGEVVESFFATQTVASRYWPDDNEVRQALTSLNAYKSIRRGRLRMILESIEDHKRGWLGTAEGMGGERVPRGKFHIEHVMPRRWQANWPLTGDMTESERDHLVNTVGNLTLLTRALNSKVSNAPWLSKRIALQAHDVLKLNVDLLSTAGDDWSDDKIRIRTTKLVDSVIAIWPVPPGHQSTHAQAVSRPRHRIGVADLIAAGLIEPGATLYARGTAHSDRTATVLPDGRLDIDGEQFDTPSGAARSITRKSVNGWWFFLLSPGGRRNLSDLFEAYVDQTAGDVDDEPAEEDDDEEVDDVTQPGLDQASSD